jgi:hypothetical protein
MNAPTEIKLHSYNWLELIYKHYLRDPFEFNFLFNDKEYNMEQYLQLMEVPQFDLQTENLFAFCMSTKKDDLNQWRVYGDNGKGVCIGFNVENILELVESNGKNFVYKELEYVDFEKITDSVAESILYKIRDRYMADKNYDLLKIIANFKSELESCILSYKHPAYESESEARLIYRKSAQTDNYKQTQANDVTIISGDSYIKTFKEIELSKMGMYNIIFGPINDIPKENVLLFLNNNGINLNPQNISHSNIPYRAR